MKKLQKKARERKTVEAYVYICSTSCGGCSQECTSVGSNYARESVSTSVYNYQISLTA